MAPNLHDAILVLRAHQSELQNLGVAHTAVFGSVARGEASGESDIDVLVELDPNRNLNIFEYTRLKLFINELFHGASAVVNLKTLKPLLREDILRDSVQAF